jgi:hypothetical protein
MVTANNLAEIGDLILRTLDKIGVYDWSGTTLDPNEVGELLEKADGLCALALDDLVYAEIERERALDDNKENQ